MVLKPAVLPIQMTVRVGSFSIEENARNFVERLSRFGYNALDVPGTDALGRHWNVVQVGPYARYDDASKAVMELSAKYRLEPVIVPVTMY
jgi:cell division septation protein DedD